MSRADDRSLSLAGARIARLALIDEGGAGLVLRRDAILTFRGVQEDGSSPAISLE
jgi:hypothetical protein